MRIIGTKSNRIVVIRLEKGDEVKSSLEKACSDFGIKTGIVTGIGALSGCTIYSAQSSEVLETKDIELEEPLEIASASGNITLKDGKPFLHLHITLGRADHTALAGHLKRGIVSFTGEFFILELPPPLSRKRDENLKMDLIDI
ncbi:MAG: PPC domain-containing DNA-binding protein [Candidatus Micrarchaeota archaeon]